MCLLAYFSMEAATWDLGRHITSDPSSSDFITVKDNKQLLTESTKQHRPAVDKNLETLEEKKRKAANLTDYTNMSRSRQAGRYGHMDIWA